MLDTHQPPLEAGDPDGDSSNVDPAAPDVK
jgi:hypothetical protein